MIKYNINNIITRIDYSQFIWKYYKINKVEKILLIDDVILYDKKNKNKKNIKGKNINLYI